MRTAKVFRNGRLAGYLTEYDNRTYEFKYEDTWFLNDSMPPISLTLPKSKKVYTSQYLFPFFFNMLSEGANRDFQCHQLRIDPNDDFGLLLATAQYDSIGAITVEPIHI